MNKVVFRIASLLFVALAMAAGAQTTLLFEGFEGVFPSGNGWTTNDTTAPVFWKNVSSAYGSVPAHSGSWKGYCAGWSNGVLNTSARYANNMTSTMSKTLSFSGGTGANLSFWYNIPSIEYYYDHFRVYMDANLLFDTYTNTSSNWVYVTFPLNAYLGGSHALRFEFDSDYSVVAEGAYLDDILVDTATQPFTQLLETLQINNYYGYVLNNDVTGLGISNIQAQAVFKVENFTGASAGYTNVLSCRLINATTGAPHPIYDFGNVVTNPYYTYNITNVIPLAAGTNVTVTNIAYIKPAAQLSQFTNYYVECKMLTNGVLAQTLTTSPVQYYHFTNTVSGDNAYNVLLDMNSAGWSRTYEVRGLSGQNSFQVNANYNEVRWDDFNGPQTSANIPIVFNFALFDADGNAVPLVNSCETFYDSMLNYVNYGYNFPNFITTSHVLDIQPAGQLDSVNETYYLTLTISETNNPVSGQVITGNTLQTAISELLDFDGHLFFGSVNTTINELGIAPPANAPAGGVIPTSLGDVGGYVTQVINHGYFSGPALSVNLLADGDAVVTAGSVTLSAPAPDNGSEAGINFQRGTVTLSTGGASGTVTLMLPTGLGYRFDTNSLVIQSTIPFPTTSLDINLDPAGSLVYSPGGTIYMAEDNKPVWMLVSKITWSGSAGSLTMPPVGAGAGYVRYNEYTYLASVSNQLVNPSSMGDKASNDKYWYFLANAPHSYFVRADGNGNALLKGSFVFGPGQFNTHFPHNTTVQWTGNGTMNVTDDLVPVASGSQLTGATTVAVSYAQGCADCSGAGGSLSATPSMNIDGGAFSFTLDGGLVATGSTSSTGVNLQWGADGGNFAQQALSFYNAAFHMPGVFVRGDQNLLAAVQAPTTILYTGFNATNLNLVERPLSSGYSQGLADYAGLNFRAAADGSQAASSMIAGTPNINWLLDGRSKYYVRPGGVTGIHEAVAGSFPSSLTLWGYPFTFTSYGLSYRDSQTVDSITDGAVSLPGPASFIENFTGMTFTCLGMPSSADIDLNDPFKVMAYWLADFRVHSMRFAQQNCGSPNGYLVFGIEGYASHITNAMYGEIGFYPGGDQIPASADIPGVTSRLKAPNVFNLDGPNGSTYVITPVQDAYYNTWSNAPGGGVPGWITICGKVKIPFFEDLKVQFQTSCRTNSSGPIYLSGGWPRTGTGNNGTNYGWVDTYGLTPFCGTNLFDANNAGWPESGGGLTIDNYRNNANSQTYHPRAQRVWLNVVTFDYPLTWNGTLRSFKSWQEVKDDLLVVNVQHQIKYMDAARAEIDFGAQYDGLPTISIANLAFNAVDGVLGVSDAITKAASKPVEDALSTGLDHMDQLVNTQMKPMMDGVFDNTVDPMIDQFYNELQNEFNSLSPADRLNFASNVQNQAALYFLSSGSGVTNLNYVFANLANSTGQASNIVGQIHSYLDDATNAIDAVINVVSVATNGQGLGSNVVGLLGKVGGKRTVLPSLLGSLVEDFASNYLDAVVGPAVSNALSDLDPALDEISSGLQEVQSNIVQVDDQLTNAAPLNQQLNDILANNAPELNSASAQVYSDVIQYFSQFNYQVDNPFLHVSPSDLKLHIRQSVEDQFFSTDTSAQIQTVIRQEVYDVDASMKEGIDTVFEQLNGAMRNLISQSLASLDNSLNQCLGDCGGSVGSAKLNGHALINGDSLSELRIDGHFQFKVPDDMELDAFLEIKELSSDGSASGCSGAHAPWTEVTIGASGIPLDFAGTDATADVEAKFTFNGTTPAPINLGGQMGVDGELDFEAFQLHDLAAAMAFGASENYLALKGGVKFDGYDFSGAIFFGRTCTLDPLKLIDPDVAGVLGNPPFTGAYVYAQGWIPISEDVLGIPASCLFDISAGVGAGAFFFAEGPTYGGKMFLGVSGELLCVVSIEGDVTLIGLKHGDDLRFKGHGHFDADLGPCPFCLKLSKDVDISYYKGWEVDF